MPANMKATIAQAVIATKQSMTRCAGLELEELARRIRDANAAGVSPGGALPIVTRGEPCLADWMARSNAILADLAAAQASNVGS